MVTTAMMLKDWVAFYAGPLKREEGQGFTEYALIFALVVLVAAAVPVTAWRRDRQCFPGRDRSTGAYA